MTRLARLAVVSLLVAAPHSSHSAATSDPPPTAMPMMGSGMMGSHAGADGMSSDRMGAMRQLMAWMGGAELSATPVEPRPTVNAALRAEGRQLYAERCAACHGVKGDGNGPEAARLTPRPRNFTTAVFRLRSTPSGALPTDEDLFATLSRGMHGTAMLPWVSLFERERWALVAYVKTFSQRFTESPPASPVAVPAALLETPALVEQGRSVYQRMQCASCHGADGRGNGPSAAGLHDDAGQPIRPPDFSRGRFLRGSHPEDLYLTLNTGLDGSPMPSYEGALTPAETWALAAYVRSLTAARPEKGGTMCPMMGGDADPQERLGMMIDMPGMPSNMRGMHMER